MRKLLLLAGIAMLFSSCGWLNSSIMLKTKKDYQYSKLPDSTKAKDYIIAANDLIEFRIFSNDGFKLIDLTSLNQTNRDYQMNNRMDFLVEYDGNVKLPILGRTKISGLTVREAELMLEEKYSSYYVKPFVLMTVQNKRVVIFPGSAGDAKVIPLMNNNTTLIEALALAGGIADDGKAKIVKLIRKNGEKDDVYLLDLSKIEGIKYANMVLQANDIIYVEPRRKYATKVLAEITPILSLLSSTLVLIWYADRVTP
ncbi:MAG: polysaccharide biosynthesis/export family protein [Bacteroidetes bacterium]|nr:polysaccharide biosynthesis/export family protein [Bacteroidota bacterium]